MREAASLSASDAARLNVIDVLAGNVPSLLQAIDGRSVTLAGKSSTLATDGSEVITFEPGLITQALAIITNPNIALILMMIGVYGLLFEFANPGTIGPGLAGAICLLLGLYALNQLPLNYAALALLLLGVACMVAEAFTPTFGALAAGGIAAFVLGAALLLDTNAPQFALSWTAIAATAMVNAAILTLLLGYVWKAQRSAVVTGRQQLIGSRAEVLDWSGRVGHVWLHGERCDATGEGSLQSQTIVRVCDVDGLTLLVRADRENDPPRAAG